MGSLFLVRALLGSNRGEGDVEFWQVDFPVAVKIDRLNQSAHFPRWEVCNVCILEGHLELISINCSGIVKVDGLEELEDGLP